MNQIRIKNIVRQKNPIVINGTILLYGKEAFFKEGVVPDHLFVLGLVELVEIAEITADPTDEAKEAPLETTAPAEETAKETPKVLTADEMVDQIVDLGIEFAEEDYTTTGILRVESIENLFNCNVTSAQRDEVDSQLKALEALEA